jgi:hypothetical protein
MALVYYWITLHRITLHRINLLLDYFTQDYFTTGLLYTGLLYTGLIYYWIALHRIILDLPPGGARKTKRPLQNGWKKTNNSCGNDSLALKGFICNVDGGLAPLWNY